MGDAGARPGELADLKRLPDEDLIRKYCANPPDREAGEELARRCLHKFQKTIRRMVFAKFSLCPKWHDRNVFVDEATSLASEGFLKGIGGFRFDCPFDGWLKAIAQNAALTLRRSITGRGSEPRTFEPLETVGERDRQLLADALYSSKFWTDPSALVKQRELHEIVVDLLKVHAQTSKHNQDSANAIALRVWDGFSPKEVAEMTGDSEARVSKLFSRDYKNLRELAERRYDITRPGEL